MQKVFTSYISFKCPEERSKEILDNILKIKEEFDKKTYTVEARSPEEEAEILKYLDSLAPVGVSLSGIGSATSSTHNFTIEDLVWICEKSLELRRRSGAFLWSESVFDKFILSPALCRAGEPIPPIEMVVSKNFLKSRYGEGKIDMDDFIPRLRDVLWVNSRTSEHLPGTIIELLEEMYGEEDTTHLGTDSQV